MAITSNNYDKQYEVSQDQKFYETSEINSFKSNASPSDSKAKKGTNSLTSNQMKAVIIIAIVGAIIAVGTSLALAAHYGKLHGAEAFFSQKIPGFFNHKFVPFVKGHIAPALKSAALKVNHFMNSRLPGTHGKLPVWALIEGANLGLLGLTVGIGFYQARKDAKEKEAEKLRQQLCDSF